MGAFSSTILVPVARTTRSTSTSCAQKIAVRAAPTAGNELNASAGSFAISEILVALTEPNLGMMTCSKSRQTRRIVAVFPTMKHADLIEFLKTYDALLRENGATALFVFGSRARGSERFDSDLDLFIDYDPAVKIPSMFRLMQIEEKISETLGIPVTITTRDALHPLMKKNIERDAVRVA